MAAHSIIEPPIVSIIEPPFVWASRDWPTRSQAEPSPWKKRVSKLFLVNMKDNKIFKWEHLMLAQSLPLLDIFNEFQPLNPSYFTL